MNKYLLSFFLLFQLLPSSFAEKTKIGVVVPLTGAVANWGKDISNGIKAANELLAPGQYELIFEDDKCDSKEAVSIAQKLVNVDKVKYVLGFACSGPLLAAAPIYEKSQVIAIAVSATASKISSAGDFIFRTWPSDAAGIRTLAEHLRKKHKHIGVLSEQTEYSLGLQEGLEQAKGDMLLEKIEFTPGTTDFKTLILKLKQKQVDGIFLNPQADLSLIPMITQLKQLGVNVPLYSIYYGASESIMNQASGLLNNLEFADLPQVTQKTSVEGKRVLNDIRSKYGIGFADILVLGAYESFRAVDSAIKSGEEPRKYLYNTSFDGTFGPWSFDKNGDIAGLEFVIKKIRGKEILNISE